MKDWVAHVRSSRGERIRLLVHVAVALSICSCARVRTIYTRTRRSSAEAWLWPRLPLALGGPARANERLKVLRRHAGSGRERFSGSTRKVNPAGAAGLFGIREQRDPYLEYDDERESLSEQRGHWCPRDVRQCRYAVARQQAASVSVEAPVAGNTSVPQSSAVG
jgi:hypothetical protein